MLKNIDRKVWILNIEEIIIISIILLLLMALSSCKQKGSEPPSANTTSALQGSVNPSKNTTETSSALNTKSLKMANTSQPTTRSVGKTHAGLPKLIDLGADKCIPCKMMKPILDELKTEYAGKLTVEVIDVWENPKEGDKYGITLIPTQIFYDPEGKEFQRHEGFMSKEDILATFKQKGMKLD